MRRAVRRWRPAAESSLDHALAGVTFLPFDDSVREMAATVRPPPLRTLDAIHLATALLTDDLDEFISYDRRLAEAARAHGLNVLSPA